MRLKITTAAVMTLAMWAVAGNTDASAAVATSSAIITAKNIETCGENQKVYIDVSHLNNDEVMFGMATKGSKSSKTTFKVSAWDVFETKEQNEIAVDLSKLSNIKDNFIAIKTDSMKVPIIVRIPAVHKAVKATYNAAEYKLEFKTGTSKSASHLTAASDYEWRTPYSNWNKPGEGETLKDGVAQNVFEEFKYQGATLYIRTPGAKKAPIKETQDSNLKTAYDARNITEEIKVYDAGSFPGREAKLNIAKQPNGPSVTARYTSGTLTLPKLSEYRVVIVKDGIKTIPDEKEFTSNDSTKSVTVTITELLTSSGSSIAKQGVLEVRTKPKTSQKKPKPASKWTRVSLSDISELNVTGSHDDIIDGIVVKDTSDSDEVAVRIEKTANSIVIRNISDDSYQIVIMNDKNTKPDIDAKPAKKLSGGKDYSINNSKNGGVVYIRKAGDSKTKTWGSDYTKIGTINLG